MLMMVGGLSVYLPLAAGSLEMLTFAREMAAKLGCGVEAMIVGAEGAAVADELGAHGVSKLISGKRFVLNMWFSTNWRKFPKHRRIYKTL